MRTSSPPKYPNPRRNRESPYGFPLKIRISCARAAPRCCLRLHISKNHLVARSHREATILFIMPNYSIIHRRRPNRSRQYPTVINRPEIIRNHVPIPSSGNQINKVGHFCREERAWWSRCNGMEIPITINPWCSPNSRQVSMSDSHSESSTQKAMGEVPSLENTAHQAIWAREDPPSLFYQ